MAFLAILGIAGEFFCRFYLGLGDPPLSRADPEIEYMFVGPRTYHRFGNTITYNAFSMRTHDFDSRRTNPEEIRVMVVGDSVINGGAPTDQSQLMTTRLEQHLKAELKKPVTVMNVSAGSWGPPNYLAYVRRYGFFEADALVVVVSSHDCADAPTFEPVVDINPDFPGHTPALALTEAISRYVPRYFPARGRKQSPAPLPTQGQYDQAMQAFETLLRMARERGIPALVAQHPELPEISMPEAEGHRLLREAALHANVTCIDWFEAFSAELKAGRPVFRDNIHPNAHGQETMEKVVYPELLKILQAKPAQSSPK